MSIGSIGAQSAVAAATATHGAQQSRSPAGEAHESPAQEQAESAQTQAAEGEKGSNFNAYA